jgi:hypothetical protein
MPACLPLLPEKEGGGSFFPLPLSTCLLFSYCFASLACYFCMEWNVWGWLAAHLPAASLETLLLSDPWAHCGQQDA